MIESVYIYRNVSCRLLNFSLKYFKNYKRYLIQGVFYSVINRLYKSKLIILYYVNLPKDPSNKNITKNFVYFFNNSSKNSLIRTHTLFLYILLKYYNMQVIRNIFISVYILYIYIYITYKKVCKKNVIKNYLNFKLCFLIFIAFSQH
jgi:hypothetical protein